MKQNEELITKMVHLGYLIIFSLFSFSLLLALYHTEHRRCRALRVVIIIWVWIFVASKGKLKCRVHFYFSSSICLPFFFFFFFYSFGKISGVYFGDWSSRGTSKCFQPFGLAVLSTHFLVKSAFLVHTLSMSSVRPSFFLRKPFVTQILRFKAGAFVGITSNENFFCLTLFLCCLPSEAGLWIEEKELGKLRRTVGLGALVSWITSKRNSTNPDC